MYKNSRHPPKNILFRRIIFMLKNWTSHAEYQQFIISNLSNLNKINSKRILELESSISKLYCLDLDILGEILLF